MRNIKLIIEYDGTGYYGWQRQSGQSTIQQTLEEKIAVITQEKIHLISSGRTDAGVHALNQVANFKTASRIPEINLLRGINSLLPPDIAVKDLTEVEWEFHSRYSAKSKVYLYRIDNRSVRPALYRNYSWFIHDPLCIENMKECAIMLKGVHDFSSFCAAGNDSRSYEREVIDVSLEKDDQGMVEFQIEANGFLKHMVRNIIGTLVYAGKGKIGPSGFESILKAKDRTLAGPTAPPQGLFLKEVKY
ncbi:MAG: tRNA pseudouridine(38-40) synthase TruA [Syntrophales bacterium]